MQSHESHKDQCEEVFLSKKDYFLSSIKTLAWFAILLVGLTTTGIAWALQTTKDIEKNKTNIDSILDHQTKIEAKIDRILERVSR